MQHSLTHFFLAVGIAIVLAAPTVRADIAPTQYVGYGIYPVKANGLCMIKAQVDITWGYPCNLKADFVINNQTTKPVDVELGFPITNVYLEKAGKLPNDIAFAFDDRSTTEHAVLVSDDPIVKKLNSIIIDKVDFKSMDIADLIPALNEKSKKCDPDHKGVHFALRLPSAPLGAKTASAATRSLGIYRTMGIEWNDISLSELLDRMLSGTGLQYSVEGDTVYFIPASDISGNHAHFAWYRHLYIFPPGPTKVTVTTKLPASLVYGKQYRESLYYCIETGGSWDGPIGSEEVAIHFPAPVTPEQVTSANPAGYSVDGNTVRWKFQEFKPKGRDHDIDIQYLRPDVITALAQARADHARAPSDPALALKLADDLFVLGPAKGYAPYPPSNLSLSELNELLDQIKDNKDRAKLKSFFNTNDLGKYAESDDIWQANRDETLRILNSIDYQPPSDRSAYVDEAKVLVEKVIQDHPDNAEAWNIYFANYYRFHFAGGTYEIGDPTYYPHELGQIKKAIILCPDDPGLKLWYAIMTGPRITDSGSPPIRALFAQIKKQGTFNNDYLDIKYDYY